MIILFFGGLLILDQISKYWARNFLQARGSISVIGDFFHLTYVENRGAAFGLLQGKSFIFVVATFFAIAMLSLYYYRQRKKGASRLKLLLFILLAIFAGAIGNLTDRILLGYVTDMIDVRGVWSFVFNLADIYVVCGTILLCYYILRFDKENI